MMGPEQLEPRIQGVVITASATSAQFLRNEQFIQETSNSSRGNTFRRPVRYTTGRAKANQGLLERRRIVLHSATGVVRGRVIRVSAGIIVDVARRGVVESRKARIKVHFDVASRAVALLGDDDIGC